MPKPNYKYFPRRPAKLTAEFAKRKMEELVERLPEAENSSSPNEWLRLYRDWEELDSYIGSEATRAHFNFDKNMADKNIEKHAMYFSQKVAPAVSGASFKLLSGFVNSRHKTYMLKKLGEQLDVVYQVALEPSNPINKNLRVKARNLTKKYDKLLATAKIKVNGKTITLWQARDFSESPDESLRREAFISSRNWFLSNQRKLADIYSQLVILRTQMAKNLGHKDFVRLGYKQMGRTDYTEADVSRFRSNIKKSFSPVNRQIYSRQAQELGKKKLRPYDTNYNPSITLPIGIVPVRHQLVNAQRVFDQLSPRLGNHFRLMRKRKLIDLPNRPNKRSGAYCSEMSDESSIVVLCNSTGSAEDIETLTHEMGHAFQGWESQAIKTLDLQWGTADFSEIHSTSMEYLAMPHLGEFFSQADLIKYRAGRWSKGIYLLCYACVVDEFQHWVYRYPEVTPIDRDKKWVEISDKYIDGAIDWSGLKRYKALRWYAQGHIFSSPFYYIDYALAEVVAMQIAMIASKDHKKAMRIYMKLCELGGTKSFLKAIKSVGLRSPFDEKLIAELAKYAKEQVSLQSKI